MSTELDLADALMSALSTYDVTKLDALLASDMTRWLSITEEETGRDALLRSVEAEREHVSELNLELRRRIRTDEGFVLLFTARGITRRGADFRIPVCLVVTERDGKVVRLEEYAALHDARALLSEMRGHLH